MIRITSAIALVVCIAALAAAAPMTNNAFEIEDRSWLVDQVLSTFGLSAFSGILGNKFDQLLEKLMYAGSAALAEARPIIFTLISDLKNHASDAAPYIKKAYDALLAIYMNSGRRDLIESRISAAEFFLDTLGFGALWSGIQNASSTAFSTFKDYCFQILYLGKAAWAQAIPVFAQLVADLKDHASNSSPYIQAALDALKQIIASAATSGRRDLAARGPFDGLVSIWSSLMADATDNWNQLLQSLLFSGQSVINQAKPVIAQLVSDVTSHFGNSKEFVQIAFEKLQAILASSVTGRRDIDMFLARAPFDFLGLGSIWSNVLASASDNWSALVASLVFAGQSVVSQAKPVLAQLVSDVTSHLTNAGPIAHAAFLQLQAIIANSIPKPNNNRAFWSLPQLESIFGVAGNVISTVSSMASDLQASFQAALQSVWASGVSSWGLAAAVLKELASDLVGHADMARPMIMAAIEKLKDIAKTHATNAIISVGRRDLKAFDWNVLNVLENFFGFGPILAQVNSVGTDLLAKLQVVLATIATEGWNVISQAKTVILQLIADIKDHAGNAKPLFEAALSQLTQIAASGASSAIGGIGKRDLHRASVMEFLEATFGLSSVMDTINGVATDVYNKFQAQLKELFNAGILVWAQAVPIFKQLVADLKDHANNAVPLLQNAMQVLHQLVLTQG